MHVDPLHTFETETRTVNNFMHQHARTAFHRYPVTFSLLSTFGIVCVLYGLEEIINSVTFLREHPFIPFCVGIIILIFTGTLYKKLNKKLD